MQSIPNAINIIYQHFTSINMVTNRDYLACSRIVLTQVNINFTSLEHAWRERFSISSNMKTQIRFINWMSLRVEKAFQMLAELLSIPIEASKLRSG